MQYANAMILIFYALRNDKNRINNFYAIRHIKYMSYLWLNKRIEKDRFYSQVWKHVVNRCFPFYSLLDSKYQINVHAR